MRVSSSGVVFDQSALASQLSLRFFLGRQRNTIARGEKLLALVQDRIARDGIVLLSVAPRNRTPPITIVRPSKTSTPSRLPRTSNSSETSCIFPP
jgi:hypothetical protein